MKVIWKREKTIADLQQGQWFQGVEKGNYGYVPSPDHVYLFTGQRGCNTYCASDNKFYDFATTKEIKIVSAELIVYI